MAIYQLTITASGCPPATRTFAAGTDDLAQTVHHHIRGLLGSARVDIRLDLGTLTGEITNHGTAAGTFALSSAAPATRQRRDHPMRGFTIHDIDRMARAACVADRSYSSDMTTRYETAWSAIALALSEADEPPARADLVRAGWQAIYREVRAVQDMHGVSREDRSGQIGSAPRFAAYWRVVHHEGADERIVEDIAVHQVLAVLSDPYRDAILALAVHDTYQAAADALGITYKALVARIGTARRRVRAAWFAPETAPAVKGTDRRVGAYGRTPSTQCGAGHEWTPENTRWDRGRSAGRRVRTCRACEHERGQQRRAAG